MVVSFTTVRLFLHIFTGGIFHDCAVHDIDTICWIVGDYPTSVHTFAHAHVDVIRSLNDVDTVVISMKFRDGTLATIDLSRFAAYGYDQRLEVYPQTYDAVHPIDVVSNHVASDKLTTQNGGIFTN